MKEINESTKVTLTLGQLKRLVKEGIDESHQDYQGFGRHSIYDAIANAAPVMKHEVEPAFGNTVKDWVESHIAAKDHEFALSDLKKFWNLDPDDYADEITDEIEDAMKFFFEKSWLVKEGRSGIPSVYLDINPSRGPNGWSKGHAYLGDTEYEVQIKWFDEPSQFGIKRGRISKLWVAKTDGYDRDEVMCYDRGWDTKPSTPEDKEILKAILKEFN